MLLKKFRLIVAKLHLNTFCCSESHCSLDGVQYVGTPLTTLNAIASATLCQFECQKCVGCKSFSYDKTIGYCQFYSLANLTKNAVSKMISGPKFCVGQDSNF